jgi:hypothetical protein
MTLHSSRPEPSWVDSGAAVNNGLDLLGLRLPVQSIGNKLINGVTTITPLVRYLSFRAWIIHVYVQARMPNRWKSFREFASRVEAAIALGNMMVNPTVVNIIGADEARELVNSDADPLPLKALVKQLAVNIYGNPFEQLGLKNPDKTEVPGLSKERGFLLAQQVHEQFMRCPLGRELAKGAPLDYAERAELDEFGVLASVTDIPDAERDLLVSAILPERPSDKERPRLATYATLLFLADRVGRVPNEKDLFAAALSPAGAVPEELHPVLDGWVKYCVRDLVAAAHEAVLRAVIDVLEDLQPEPGASVLAGDVIRNLVGRVGEHSETLSDLGIITPGESPLDLSFRQVFERVEKLTAEGLSEHHGLNSWQGRLHEVATYGTALSSDAGAAAVLPVAWALAVRRAEAGVSGDLEDFQLLSLQGWARVGLREVIIPSVQTFLREDRLYGRVMADLARRTVEQHLRISWTRMAADPRRDVAVLTSDGERWSYRKFFNAGRTASRIHQAAGWLRQLGLVNERGLTTDGRASLARSLETLNREAAR